MKGLILAAATAALVSVALNFGTRTPQFAVGFERLWDDLDEMAILAAIGVGAIRIDGGLRWIALLGPVLAAAVAGYLTVQGLRIPETALGMSIALLLIGAAGSGGARLAALFAPLAVAAAALVGHAAGLGGGMGDPVLLGGFSAFVAALILGGAAIGALGDQLSPGLANRIAAGVAGVGAYQLFDRFLI